MAIIFSANGAVSQSGSAASLTPALPTMSTGGGALVAVCFSKNNATHSTVTSGWTKLTQVNAGASFTMSVFTSSDVGAAAPVITWTGAVACAAQVVYYSSNDGAVDSTPGASSSNGTSGSPHTSTSINTTLAESLVIYIDGCDTNTAVATPAGWAENLDQSLTTTVGRLAWGSKTVATSGSASGAISVTGGTGNYVQFQIELKQDAPVSGLEFSTVTHDIVLLPPEAYTAPKMEMGIVLEPNINAASFLVLEIGTWLEPIPNASTWKPRTIIC